MNCLIKIIFPNFRSLYAVVGLLNKRMITIKTSEMWFYDECCVQHGLTVSNKQVGHTSRNLLKVIVNRQIRFVGPVTRKKSIESHCTDRDDCTKTSYIEEDKEKRSRTGYQPRVEMNGTATKFWKFVKTVMSICWSPTPESDTAFTSDRMWWLEVVSTDTPLLL